MIDICFIYRKRVKEFFSIEKVFGILINQLKDRYRIRQTQMPENRFTIQSLYRNIGFARKQKARLYHVTGDVHYVVLGLPAKKTILTIHDCVFLLQATGFKRMILKKLLLDWPVKHSRIVTTISEATKKDILNNCSCDPDKIVVIPNPYSLKFSFSIRNFNSGEPRILFIGTTANKNLERVIEALEGINCILEIIGIIPEKIKALLDKSIRWENAFYLSEEDLAGKYQACDIVLFPSLFEGFGLPVLEAQLSGRPVITSNIEPLLSVAGEGACFVDPLNIDSIRAGVLKVCSEDEYRAGLIAKGKLNAERYSPAKIANAYAEVYNHILNSSN